MKKSSGNFFIIIGVLLIIAGVSLYSYDLLLSFIGVILGAYNMFKGIRMTRGIQPLVYRRQKKYKAEKDDALQNKQDHSNN